MKQYKVAILGATGAVGREMMKILAERDFPVAELHLLASERSVGQLLPWKGQDIAVELACDEAFKGMDIVLGAAENDIAKRFAPAIVKAGAVFVDNSSAFRMDPDVPLVIPEINPEDDRKHKGIIANPNCTTIVSLVAINALNQDSPIESIIASSYQAVSGAGQVLGAVTASTLTTVCVFAPIVFVEGLTKQLFTDLALTITYSLLASLLVALTLVPAMASGMLRRDFTPKAGLLDKLYPAYRKAISWSLDHKAFVLLLSLVLLVTSAWGALSRGFTFMPEIDMNNLSLEITMPEGTTREEAVEAADQVMERAMSVENVEAVGFMMGSGNMGGLSMTSSDNGDYDVTGYLTMTEGTFGSDAGREIEALCGDLPCTVKASGVMSGMMSYMTGSGISLQVYGDDMEGLQTAARALGQRIGQVEGVKDVSDGLEDAAPALQVVVDRNAAMTRGVTVAQIYMQVAAALRTAESWEGPLTDTLCREVRTAAENIRAIIAEAQKKVSLS